MHLLLCSLGADNLSGACGNWVRLDQNLKQLVHFGVATKEAMAIDEAAAPIGVDGLQPAQPDKQT